jgi:hypothetical protein
LVLLLFAFLRTPLYVKEAGQYLPPRWTSGFVLSLSGQYYFLPNLSDALSPELAARYGVSSAIVPYPGFRAGADSRLLTRQPTRPEDLPRYFSTSRKRYDLPFELADAGMEAHVRVCWQTPRNKDGPYCPIVSRIIA